MSDDPTGRELARRLGAKRRGKGWECLCGAHNDRNTPNLSIDEGEGGRALVKCRAGCSQADVLAWLRRDGHWPPLPETPRPKGQHKPNGQHKGNGSAKLGPIIATYDYQTANRSLAFQATRHAPKAFRQRRPNGKGGWIWNLNGVERVLYRLPALLAAPPEVTRYLCEGEKDCDRLASLGLIATTNPMGADNFKPAQAKYLAGRDVALLVDNDDAGEKRAVDVPPMLAGIARSVRVIRLPGLDVHGDVSDWLDAGGTVADLERIVSELPEYQPPQDAPRDDDEPSLPVIIREHVRLGDYDGRDIPARSWIVEHWIPAGQVTGVYGVGGINKTDFLLQLLMARAAGLPFLGRQIEAGASFGLFCEDEKAELIRRATRIAKGYGRPLAGFTDCHFVSLVGQLETEFITFDGPKPIIGQELIRFDQAIVRLGAGLAVLDTVADFYGGSENSRREVSQFFRLLDMISLGRGCAIVVSAHPSIRGQSSGALDFRVNSVPRQDALTADHARSRCCR